MQPLITIIVPCYNAEKRIIRCINSLLQQTYKNIEIILINDGSSDNTLEIITKFKESNKNIIVISKENGGAGTARNLGIKKSHGDYVTFVDSDDELEKCAIEKMVIKLDNSTDIIISGMKYIDQKGGYLYSQRPNYKLGCWNELKFNGTAFKLYRRKFLLDNGITFGLQKIHEDLLFSVHATSLSNNIKVLSSDNYIVYKGNSNSLTFSMKGFYINGSEINNLLCRILEIINIDKYGINTVKFFLLKTLIYDIMTYKSNGKTEGVYYENYKFIQNKLGNIKFYFQPGETLKINFIINVFILFTKIHCIGVIFFFKKILIG